MASRFREKVKNGNFVYSKSLACVRVCVSNCARACFNCRRECTALFLPGILASLRIKYVCISVFYIVVPRNLPSLLMLHDTPIYVLSFSCNVLPLQPAIFLNKALINTTFPGGFDKTAIQHATENKLLFLNSAQLF